MVGQLVSGFKGFLGFVRDCSAVGLLHPQIPENDGEGFAPMCICHPNNSSEGSHNLVVSDKACVSKDVT